MLASFQSTRRKWNHSFSLVLLRERETLDIRVRLYSPESLESSDLTF
jgi:hypothetical protein